jgi:hypothetical protein
VIALCAIGALLHLVLASTFALAMHGGHIQCAICVLCAVSRNFQPYQGLCARTATVAWTRYHSEEMTMSLSIIIRGEHDTGKTAVASLIKMFLEENGFSKVSVKDIEPLPQEQPLLKDLPPLRVSVKDIEPLPQEQKDGFWYRFTRNRERPIQISVELESAIDVDKDALERLGQMLGVALEDIIWMSAANEFAPAGTHRAGWLAISERVDKAMSFLSCIRAADAPTGK